MLVDDHGFVRSAIRQALTATDIEVVGEASSAEEALRIAPELRPDVLLIDIDLPGASGLRLLRELRPRLPDAKFVMLTVSTSQADVLEAVRLGAVGYLTKDLDADALLRAIRGVGDGDLAMPRKLAARTMRDLVDGVGARAMERGTPGLDALSPREDEILRLLADGMTDREIAEALTISTRTVETHVSNILRKLDARNRAEAARRYVDDAEEPRRRRLLAGRRSGPGAGAARALDREARPVAEGDEQPFAGQRELVDLAELDLERRVPHDQQSLGREDELAGELVRAVAEEVAGDQRRGSDVDRLLARPEAFGRSPSTSMLGSPSTR